MGAIFSCAVTGATFCFCTACSSLFKSCCGNDKPSSVPPSITSGRKRSVALLLLAIAIAFAFQYGAAPRIADNPLITSVIYDNWISGCEEYRNSNINNDVEEDNNTLLDSCVGNAGVFRVGAVTTLFFFLAAIAVLLKPSANREAWPAKYVLYLFLCGATIFIPNDPLFTDIYLNIGRIGGILFVFLQQIIILDVAYDWNDSWVIKADEADRQEPGSGKMWLGSILASCAVAFTLSIVGVVLLLVYYTGCPTNNAFIALTLVFGIGITAAQLSGSEGSLLSSACIFLWSVFLCYTAVSKNPNSECNPRLGEPDALGILLGVLVTIVSLCWTGWSLTAEEKLQTSKLMQSQPADAAATNESSSINDPQRRPVTGYVANNDGDEEGGDANASEEAPTTNTADEAILNDPKYLSNSWKLNAILALVACWMSMALTNWGSIYGNGDAANPQVGETGMWMIIASQWLVMSLYLWTLVAPRLFPNREFS